MPSLAPHACLARSYTEIALNSIAKKNVSESSAHAEACHPIHFFGKGCSTQVAGVGKCMAFFQVGQCKCDCIAILAESCYTCDTHASTQIHFYISTISQTGCASPPFFPQFRSQPFILSTTTSRGINKTSSILFWWMLVACSYSLRARGWQLCKLPRS